MKMIKIMMIFSLSLILLIEKGTLPAAENPTDNEIIVNLETTCTLLPMYVAKIQQEESSFDQTYLDKLAKVLDFDLNHNGKVEAITKRSKEEAFLKGVSFDQFGNSAFWKSQNIFHLIKLKIKDKKLEASLFFISDNKVKKFEGLELNGDLSHDRREIHALADAIFESLFHEEGIAKEKFLYVVKEKDAKGEYVSNVFEADYDGFNARQVTKDQGYCITPTYLPAKKNHLPSTFFYVSYKTGQSKIYRASLKEGVGVRLNDFKGNQLMPALSRDQDKVAFISDYTGNPDLFLQLFDPNVGIIEKPQQIFALKYATQGSPTFSPDGKKIAFVSNKDGSPRIYLMKIPEKGAALKDIKPELISKENRENTAPVFSPDGLKLAYCSMVKGFRQIFIYDFEKREEIQLTDGAQHKENPTFAKNSFHLIFNSTGKNGGGELYLMNLNQKKVVKISQGPGEKHFPSF